MCDRYTPVLTWHVALTDLPLKVLCVMEVTQDQLITYRMQELSCLNGTASNVDVYSSLYSLYTEEPLLWAHHTSLRITGVTLARCLPLPTELRRCLHSSSSYISEFKIDQQCKIHIAMFWTSGNFWNSNLESLQLSQFIMIEVLLLLKKQQKKSKMEITTNIYFQLFIRRCLLNACPDWSQKRADISNTGRFISRDLQDLSRTIHQNILWTIYDYKYIFKQLMTNLWNEG